VSAELAGRVRAAARLVDRALIAEPSAAAFERVLGQVVAVAGTVMWQPLVVALVRAEAQLGGRR
jgi:hypothetical protein